MLPTSVCSSSSAVDTSLPPFLSTLLITSMDVQERELIPVWAPELILLSYLISWLGAYTSTQIMIHARYTRSTLLKWVWTFFASIAFGFCAIWSMHFVGMLACRLDVTIGFDIPLTILSAAIAIVFTFAALSSPYASEKTESSKFTSRVMTWHYALLSKMGSSFRTRPHDLEAGYTRLETTEHDDQAVSRSIDDDGDDGDEHDFDYEDEPEDDRRVPADRASISSYDRTHHMLPSGAATQTSQHGLLPTLLRSIDARRLRNTKKSPPPTIRRPTPSSEPRRSEELEDSLESSNSTSNSSSDSLLHAHNLPGITLASSAPSSWSASLHVGLSREARMRIKAQARERPAPEFGWQYWVRAHYETISVFLTVRAAIWGIAIAFTHYCGMWAMEIPEGRITWDMRLVTLSYLVAFAVCFVGCIAMVHMEAHFGRQVAFSTIAATGCCSMHYIGMAAATFHSYAPPSPQARYPPYLPVTIICVAVFVCVVSNGMLAHSAIIARNRMAEMIITKRRLWRIMAEKEAAEQAIELKQQFISVASHEIRTPLHTVNGYCELLVRTHLTEEQSLYVTSIQQACHAINVIAGNVLDFSKLDRNNVELSARPVHMELRKMLENLARLTEARGTQPGELAIDVVVCVAKDVPLVVYLDETYTFRVLMNLLSNAQKFCEQGYICVAVSMVAADQLMIKVSDTGCGIPQSFRGALFEPFRQADTSLTRPRQGTGLGLSIVKHLVQRMSGTVDVESVEGSGSTFVVRLPVPLPSPPPSPATLPLPATKRLRVIFQDERTQQLFVDLWTQYGYTVSAGAPGDSVEELAQGVDTIWSDAQSVAHSPALRMLMCASVRPAIAMFIVHSESHELSALEPELSEARNVALVQRPIIMHHVAEWIEHPEEHMGSHIIQGSSKVRFVIPAEEAQLHAKKNATEQICAAPVDAVLVDGTLIPLQPTRDKVLLVEDNLVNQRLGSRLLGKLGYEVVTANDGQQAIDAIMKTPYSCCLMDCQMPVLDGFAATRKIRELEHEGVLPGHIPIIALTANVTHESEDECRASGMDHFLPKPMKFTDLDLALSRFKRPARPQ